jgi:hypothetical protein
MKKRGKSKLLAIVGISVILLLVTSVLMTAANNSDTEQVVEEKTQKEISADVGDYVEQFVEERGIDANEINNITQVNFEDLPKEVNIENVDNTNLAIYQINYNQSSQKQDNLFVITYSVEKLQSQGDLIIAQDKREFLNFGFSGEASESAFLKSASGVESSLDKGYVMMRSGSITGISTSLEALSGEGNVEIVVYRNGKAIQFGNTFVVSSAEVKKDYDVQSKDTVLFEAGDVISVYIQIPDGVSVKDINTLIEITTSN